MRCRKAHKLLQELLDGCLTERAGLDRHLGECVGCRAYLARLQRVSEAVQDEVRCTIDDASLERLTARVQTAVAAERVASAPTVRVRTWRALAAAALLMAVFGSGALAGRTLWPRETVARSAESVGETTIRVVEKRVEVPVERERVVERIVRVPAVRSRVVIRYLPQRAGPTRVPTPALASAPGAIAPKPHTVMLSLPTPGTPPQIEYSESVRLATLAVSGQQR